MLGSWDCGLSFTQHQIPIHYYGCPIVTSCMRTSIPSHTRIYAFLYSQIYYDRYGCLAFQEYTSGVSPHYFAWSREVFSPGPDGEINPTAEKNHHSKNQQFQLLKH